MGEVILALSAQTHPDRAHASPETERIAANHQFTELNAAYSILRDPKERLRHLLELELGAKPADVQQVPPDLVDWQFEIGALCRAVDAFLAENAKITSPIVRVQRFEPGQEWTEKLKAAQSRINSRRDESLAELKSMNNVWASEKEHPLKRIEVIYRLLGYLGRWSGQIQERIVRLAF